MLAQTSGAARYATGTSRAELAKRLGKSPSYVAKIELKERRVDVVEFIEFLRAADTDDMAALNAVRTALSQN
jgi:transcriptional regulator with XRE-family HTH domain